MHELSEVKDGRLEPGMVSSLILERISDRFRESPDDQTADLYSRHPSGLTFRFERWVGLR
jgi:hypothetical protein